MIAPWQYRYLHFIGKRNEGLKSGSFGQVYIVSKWESRNKVPKYPVFVISSLANFFSVDLYPATPEVTPWNHRHLCYISLVTCPLWWSHQVSCFSLLPGHRHAAFLTVSLGHCRYIHTWGSCLSSSEPGALSSPIPMLLGTHTTQPFIPLDSAQMSPPTTIIQAAHILGVISYPISLLIFFIKVKI